MTTFNSSVLNFYFTHCTFHLKILVFLVDLTYLLALITSVGILKYFDYTFLNIVAIDFFINIIIIKNIFY